MEYRSGFIAIVGRPNAGKSTLLNALLKEKIAIMSDKPNTTRNNISGILTNEDAQYIFVDTPGIHKPQQQLGRVLNKNAYTAMEDCDCIAWIIDVTQSFGSGDEFILSRIQSLHKPVILIVNKVDCISKEKLMKKLLNWQSKFDFNEIVPISALKKNNIEELLKVFYKYLPEGPMLFPEEMKSDHDLNFQMCEIVREKILFKTHDEIPHSIAVLLEKKEITDKGMKLQMMVVVDRDSQKGILIGKQGNMIRSIRLDAQKELSKKCNCRVELELYVRVEKNWRNHEQKIKEFGLDELNDDFD
ncbi:GTPase Era [Floccifex sp.]|uniref:GTPase Era n=1 Tax=Floccifex sp. TaxID=2815810 RepID=UPI002A74D914|nr:GTPase Era [Floccifex sp.]MDD7282043.1 GTPase Era [Erysipelotrichaceae bacterium]MDY2958101.1 GTPase Era [Floccifex sp.]